MKLNQLEFVNRKKVESDYEALQERLRTLPDKLSYDIMVCTGKWAQMLNSSGICTGGEVVFRLPHSTL